MVLCHKGEKYLCIQSIALSTLWKLPNDILKAIHGFLYLGWVVSSVCLSVLQDKKKGNKVYTAFTISKIENVSY